MANKKMSDLAANPDTTLTAVAVGDYILIYDISEPLDVNKIKVITQADFLKLTTETARQAMVTGQAAGDLFYGASATALTRLAKGTNGQVLTQGASVPSWVTSPTAPTLAQIYPVGCIYTTTVSTNPATVFGFGTWAAFGAGRVFVGLDAGQTEFNTNGETGGEKTHTLITAEMPAHTHTDREIGGSGSIASGGGGYSTDVFNTGSTGGGGAHNNLQPYIVVYFFQRTA